ncbi:hypothetical protein WJX81_005044 [Elliptochloris bilobata]|uniref:Uncharacterized protein n=1 Tax=Elliptochloris bilobata TaxID=381761 RepID=A0AAW1R0W6_9CHLO
MLRGGGGGYGGSGGFGGARIAPDREATQGTVARPGRSMRLPTKEETGRQLEDVMATVPDSLKELGRTRVQRPGFGREGRQVKAFHYDVTITGKARAREDDGGGAEPLPERECGPLKPLPANTCRMVMQAVAEQQQWPLGWVFDGFKNLYTPNAFLPQHETHYEVTIPGEDTPRERSFAIRIKWAATVDIKAVVDFVRGKGGADIPQDAIQALDVALKHNTAMNPKCQAFARAFFWQDPDKVRPLGGGAEVWLGYQQSLRPCESGLTLNVDLAATAFLQVQPVHEYLARSAGLRDVREFSRGMTPMQHKKASKAIAGIRVETSHVGKRAYKVKGLTERGTAHMMFFNSEENREMSVAEYFEIRYKVRLQYPDVPCLNVGTPRKPNYLPAELCTIAPGQRRLKLDERQTAEMIKTAAQPPDERARFIEKSVTEFARLPSDETVRAFGMKVDSHMIEVDARVLVPPALSYSRTTSIRPPDHGPQMGAWNLQRLQFNNPATIHSFALASFADQRRAGRGREDPGSLEAFMCDQLDALASTGIRMPEVGGMPECVWHNPNSLYPGDTLKAALEMGAAYFGTQPQIIFVCLPDTSAELYKEVKRASDSFLGVPSQCFVTRKASIGVPAPRGRPQYCSNIAMKVNAKLGGTNCILDGMVSAHPWTSKPFMVCGADVTHPMGFSETEPSIAAVVASLDRYCSRYAAEVLLQGHRVEIIQDLKETMKKLLLAFYRANRHYKPERLVFYRDGVSEGQFNEVQSAEIPQIAAACAELGESAGETYAPKITFIVVQKRHHTRLFPTDPRMRDRSGNVQPGTVVDKAIVHPVEFGFFLNSHAGIQGTSRPTHYHVLVDQVPYSADQLQKFTYDLCYLFCRCTRSVSVCPPAYYAHLAAFRGRSMLSHADSSESETSRTTGGGRTQVEFASIHPNLATTMFYV